MLPFRFTRRQYVTIFDRKQLSVYYLKFDAQVLSLILLYLTFLASQDLSNGTKI